MISIIICSISPEKLQQVSRNINETIGVEYELIAIDNRELNWSITKVYNEGARRAKYSYLFFVHEDVLYHSRDWGRFIIDKLSEPDCGVVGFMGSRALMKCYSGWGQDYDWVCGMCYQGFKTGETQLLANNVYRNIPFQEVVVLDGLGLFVRKDVWEQYQFDEVQLQGFHCYDIDFTIRISADRKYHNYVCTSLDFIIEHTSEGSYNDAWYSDTIRLFKTKWNDLLPLHVEALELSEREIKKKSEKYFHYFVRRVLKSDYHGAWGVLKDFLKYKSFSLKHIGHCVEDIFRYLMRIVK